MRSHTVGRRAVAAGLASAALLIGAGTAMRAAPVDGGRPCAVERSAAREHGRDDTGHIDARSLRS